MRAKAGLHASVMTSQVAALHPFVTRANYHSRLGLISTRNSRCSNWLLVNELEYSQRLAVQGLGRLFRGKSGHVLPQAFRALTAKERETSPSEEARGKQEELYVTSASV